MSYRGLENYYTFCKRHKLDFRMYLKSGGAKIYKFLVEQNSGTEPAIADFLVAHGKSLWKIGKRVQKC